VYSSGDVLYGGQQAPMYAEVDSQDDARRQVRRMKAYGARMIKVYQQPRRDERLWFAQACREEHMLLTVEGAGELHTDLTTVMDGFTSFEHALPYELHDDVIQLLARAHTTYTPTLIVAYGGPEAEHYFYQQRNPHDDEKLRRFVPHPMLDQLARRHTWVALDEFHFPTVANSAAAVRRAGGHCHARRTRAAAGSRRALGVVGAGGGGAARGQDGHDAVRGAQGVDARSLRRRSGSFPTSARSRPESSRTWSCSTRTRWPTSTTA
jgi:hypothetical protein